MQISTDSFSSSETKIAISNNKQEFGHTYLYFLKNDLHDKPIAVMEDLFIKTKHRRQGLGTQLIRKVIALAREEGCYKLVATSRHSRTKVHKLYQKVGFKDHGREFRMDLK